MSGSVHALHDLDTLDGLTRLVGSREVVGLTRFDPDRPLDHGMRLGVARDPGLNAVEFDRLVGHDPERVAVLMSRWDREVWFLDNFSTGPLRVGEGADLYELGDYRTALESARVKEGASRTVHPLLDVDANDSLAGAVWSREFVGFSGSNLYGAVYNCL